MSASLSQQRPPGRELFFAPLEISLHPTACEGIHFAYQCSKHGHANQTRDDGTRYFDHPKAAAWICIDELGVRDPRAIKVLLLHDMQEDSYLLSPYRISLNFGKEIALDVRALTKLPKGTETTAVYMGRVITRGAYAILAKLCDRLHNNRSMSACSAEKRVKQISETREYHLKLLVPALRNFGGQWAEYADALEGKIIAALAQYAEA